MYPKLQHSIKSHFVSRNKMLLAFTLLLLSPVVLPITLECAYQTSAEDYYTCFNDNLIVNADSEQIDDVVGNHLEGKSNDQVEKLFLLSSLMWKLPTNLFQHFPQLLWYVVHGIGIRGKYLDGTALVQGDFHGAESLQFIVITGVGIQALGPNIFEGAENLDFISFEACSIREIDSKAFSGLSKLRSLSLNFNLLQVLNDGIFSHLTNLKILSVGGNKIEVIDDKLFENLGSLQKVSFANNLIQIIGKNVSQNLPNLEEFSLKWNICVNETFGTAKVPIGLLKSSTANCTREWTLKMQLYDLKTALKRMTDKVKQYVKEYKSESIKNAQLRNPYWKPKRKASRKSQMLDEIDMELSHDMGEQKEIILERIKADQDIILEEKLNPRKTVEERNLERPNINVLLLPSARRFSGIEDTPAGIVFDELRRLEVLDGFDD